MRYHATFWEQHFTALGRQELKRERAFRLSAQQLKEQRLPEYEAPVVVTPMQQGFLFMGAPFVPICGVVFVSGSQAQIAQQQSERS